jgi:hypothetical protein
LEESGNQVNASKVSPPGGDLEGAVDLGGAVI